ncbi:HAE1 family hydrophobic/amphiphilic exporter-1 [Natronospira proteinivora]|uniref:HAE1 family hydrophobic/amphiphilic exporter-1 n=1 Tax=Natronospira proteinivora TaxID=1807133 RepID=A0ABT1GA11_9GAMM|nr:efflux RND transporter permease subunit [Natronospira proteinivora]MCP1727128.1 HAE1 family hydrophobic/amphiphilic exporter-1 [Natronospira proteinivora]
MTLPEFSVRRHVMAFMMSAVLVLFGLIGYNDIGTDRLPDIDFPIISVVTVMPGADPDIVDASVTREIERTVNTVPGIEDLQSTSSPGTSSVTITFDLDVDIDVAFNDVQAKVREVVNQLPTDAEDPIISKVEADAQPVMWLSLQGDRTLQQLSDYADNNIRRRLETVSGVGDVLIGGGRERNIRIELDMEDLAAERLAVQDVIDVLESEHFQLPGGFLVGGVREQLVKLDMEYDDPDELAQMIIANREGHLVRLGDVAEIVDGLDDYRSLARFQGEETIGIGVVKIAGTNTVEIVNEVRRRVAEEIEPQLPPGMQLTVSSDQSVFINNLIDNLERTLILAVILAALVMWFFLKSLRSTLIIAASIPVSLLAVVSVIYFFGYTLNSMTMLAILLLIGVVVDDAIVVLENIYRHREEGEEDPVKASIDGSNQVFFAIIASSLSLISIFGPVIFMEGIIGRFFESFAVVVVFGILASTFVALTLIPMLCSRFLHVPKAHGKTYWVLENGFRAMDRFYRGLLSRALTHRALVMLVAVVLVVPAFMLAGQLGGEFAPEEDEGQFVVNYRVPLGSSIHYSNERLQEIEAIVAEQPEVDAFFAAIGLGQGTGQVNEGIAFVRLKDYSERDASQQEVMARISERFEDLSGVRAFASPPGLVGGQRGEPLQFFLQGPDVEELAELARDFENRLNEVDGMGRVDLDLRLDQPEINLHVDREEARMLGLTTFDVARAVNVLVGGIDVARYDDDFGGGERYDVRLKGREDQFEVMDDIRRIQLRTANGDLVRLDQVARLEESIGPAVISRFNLDYSAPFYVDPDVPLGEAVDKLNDLAAEVLPLGYNVEITGEAREFERTIFAILFVFAMAIILVYMVLGSQFNSFIQPVIVMLAMPLAIMGALVGLFITGQSLNIFSMIGMVLLIGVVTKNSILLIDLTNQFRDKRGLSVDEALKEACPIRLRPVLMTSLTLILAMVPAALDTGAGAEGNSAMGVAIIFGMMASTLLTLVVIPTAYSLVENYLARKRQSVEPAAQE